MKSNEITRWHVYELLKQYDYHIQFGYDIRNFDITENTIENMDKNEALEGVIEFLISRNIIPRKKGRGVKHDT